MKAIQAIDLTDQQWKLYEQLEEDINTKYYPEEAGKRSGWEKLKEDSLNDMEIAKEDLLNYYLIFENEKAVGWIGIRLLGSNADFVFDGLYDVIPDNFMEAVFQIVRRFLFENDKTEIYSSSKRKAKVDALLKSGGIIIDKKFYYKLNKEDINIEKLREITEDISKKIDYKLVLYDTIHEEILDRYVDIYNDARVDMNQFNPEKQEIKKRTKDDVLRKLKWDKGPDDKMFMYVLFDKENIAAFCSLFIRKENKHMIDQAGGLTTVGRNYRGQNLAKYLKAEMYLKMLEVYPGFEFIRTDTYPWNKYMYRINEEMGFKPYEEYAEIKFQISN